MPDTFTEVTRESWAGRLGDAFKGVVVGLILFLLAFPLLSWNEGRAVARHKTLEEGGGAVVSIDCGAVDPANEGKLVHATGRADTGETLADPTFGVSAVALKLQRAVEMYQWQERAESRTRKKVGGGTETTTTYSYQKGWAGHAIDSSSFHDPAGHQNPDRMPHASQTWTAGEITLGAFRLPPSLAGRIDRAAPLEVPSPDAVPEAVGETVHPYAGGYFLGSDPASPRLGDLRIAFRAVPPTDISLIARQAGNTFEPYQASAGGTIELLQIGILDSRSMIEQAQAGNRALTWVLRVVGFLLMMIGLNMVLRPLAVLADVVPFIGSIVGAGSGLVALLIALALSSVTIAIAWLVYRPLIGGALLVAAGIAGFLIIRAVRKASPGA